MRNKFALASICAIAMLAAGAAASAEGIASQGITTGGASDRSCLVRADQIIAQERGSPNFRRVVRGRLTRRAIYTDGSVDFACFPNQVVITVYFSNAGNARAEADLRNFLRAF